MDYHADGLARGEEITMTVATTHATSVAARAPGSRQPPPPWIAAGATTASEAVQALGRRLVPPPGGADGHDRRLPADQPGDLDRRRARSRRPPGRRPALARRARRCRRSRPGRPAPPGRLARAGRDRAPTSRRADRAHAPGRAAARRSSAIGPGLVPLPRGGLALGALGRSRRQRARRP